MRQRQVLFKCTSELRVAVVLVVVVVVVGGLSYATALLLTPQSAGTSEDPIKSRMQCHMPQPRNTTHKKKGSILGLFVFLSFELD